MARWFRGDADQRRLAFLEAARTELGQRPSPDGSTAYGQSIGHGHLPWAGAFVDWCARSGGLELPSHAAPLAGLAEMLAAGRQVLRPEPGDLVYYAFPSPTVGPHGGPHVGIVADASRLHGDGAFRAVEGMTTSGLPRAGAGGLGVYERTRSTADVLAFCRPDFARRRTEPVEPTEGGLPLITPAHLTTGRRSRAVETFQRALVLAVGLRGHASGQYDQRTERAVARYQRRIGFLSATGQPDPVTVRRLGRESGLYRTE